MKIVLKTIIYFFLITISFVEMHAQDFELRIHTKDSTTMYVLKSFEYLKNHKSKQSVINEVRDISKKIALKGFINNNYYLTQNDSVFNCLYVFNTKIDSVRIYYNNKLIDKTILNRLTKNYTNTYFEILTSDIEYSLNYIVAYFENKGASFTSTSLINLSQEKNKLTANLQLNISANRKINTVIIKGYSNFPKKYLNHYLNLNQKATFNLKTLNLVGQLINTIPFVVQFKKPKVLFTKDSTTLYLYLKKKQISTFDGVIGFSNKEDSNKLIFNGYLNLNLNNIFNKGELFSLNWKNNGEETQTLNLKFTTPYIFNSKFNTSGEFSIYKQDSIYVNTTSKINISYNITRNNYIDIILTNENSNLTSTSTTLDISDFKNTFIGVSYAYKSLQNIKNSNSPKIFINIEYLKGKRLINNTKNKQDKIKLSGAYLFELNQKNSIFIKSTNELLIGKNLLQNELYRIGGINSIRGFDEQSIFTSKYAVSNIEYHHSISQNSQLYSITDVGILLDPITNSTSKLYSIGLGYTTISNNSIINLSYVIGKSKKTSLNFNTSKIHIKITYPF
ncbi:MAG: hypothetical protein QM495_03580 [Lutibacter sp.]|uniref:hypothetical protein n=1 Tax=Lutibacter sp. TaxID=1925666 RepID=UPI00385C5EB1